MDNRKMTNTLLLLIFLSLTALLVARFPAKEVSAETFKLDQCITAMAYDKPNAYLHVIVHEKLPMPASVQAEEPAGEAAESVPAKPAEKKWKYGGEY